MWTVTFEISSSRSKYRSKMFGPAGKYLVFSFFLIYSCFMSMWNSFGYDRLALLSLRTCSSLLCYHFCAFPPQFIYGLWVSPFVSSSLFSYRLISKLFFSSSTILTLPFKLSLPCHCQTPYLPRIFVLGQLPARLPINYPAIFLPARVAN